MAFLRPRLDVLHVVFFRWRCIVLHSEVTGCLAYPPVYLAIGCWTLCFNAAPYDLGID